VQIPATAFSSVLNLGFERAAHGLTELTGHQVELDITAIAIQPVDNVTESLGPMSGMDLASVRQSFSGSVTADALSIAVRADARQREIGAAVRE